MDDNRLGLQNVAALLGELNDIFSLIRELSSRWLSLEVLGLKQALEEHIA